MFFFYVRVRMGPSKLFFSPTQVLRHAIVLPVVLSASVHILLLLAGPLIRRFITTFLRRGLFRILVIVNGNDLISHHATLRFRGRALFFSNLLQGRNRNFKSFTRFRLVRRLNCFEKGFLRLGAKDIHVKVQRRAVVIAHVLVLQGR